MLADSLIRLAIPIASLIDKKNDTKYVDKLNDIKRELHDEELKSIPDDGLISYLHVELVRISAICADSVESKTP